MIDRVFGTEEIGVSFVQGFDILGGAIGTSANVFNQNVVVVGSSDEDLAMAANAIVPMKGGFVAVREGKVIADFPTPLNGLVLDLDVAEYPVAYHGPHCGLARPGCGLERPRSISSSSRL